MKRHEFIASATATGLFAPNISYAFDASIAKEAPIPDILAPKVVRIKGGNLNEIHVVPDHYALYLTIEENKAIRYYVGVGRDGLYKSGTF